MLAFSLTAFMQQSRVQHNCSELMSKHSSVCPDKALRTRGEILFARLRGTEASSGGVQFTEISLMKSVLGSEPWDDDTKTELK